MIETSRILKLYFCSFRIKASSPDTKAFREASHAANFNRKKTSAFHQKLAEIFLKPDISI